MDSESIGHDLTHQLNALVYPVKAIGWVPRTPATTSQDHKKKCQQRIGQLVQQGLLAPPEMGKVTALFKKSKARLGSAQ